MGIHDEPLKHCTEDCDECYGEGAYVKGSCCCRCAKLALLYEKNQACGCVAEGALNHMVTNGLGEPTEEQMLYYMTYATHNDHQVLLERSPDGYDLEYYQVMCWLQGLGFIEHGSAIRYVWLTSKGRKWLQDKGLVFRDEDEPSLGP